MAERWIVPPADLPLVDPDTDEPIMEKGDGDTEKPMVANWVKCMRRALNHPRLTGPLEGIKSANLIKRRLKACTVGVPFSVPEDDWKRFDAVLRDADNLDGKDQQRGSNVLATLIGYRLPSIMLQLEDFITAWTDAPSKKPEETKESPA